MQQDIIKMWNEGHPSTHIAATLKISRNSVMGTVYRAQAKGLAMKKGPTVPTNNRPPKPSKTAKPSKPVERRAPAKTIKVVDSKIVIEKRIGPAVTELPKSEIKVAPKKLMQLNTHDCRWMVKDGYFCGQPSKSILRPWCEEHYKLVYVPVARKKAPFKLPSRVR